MIKALVLALALAGPAWASGGYGLDLPGKSPLRMRVLDPQDASDPLSLREPLLYLGYTLTWRPASRTAELERGEVKATLVLEDSWVYLNRRRRRLSAPLRWISGRLSLPRAAAEELLAALGDASVKFRPLEAAELAALPERPVPAAEPTLEPSGEPRIESAAERLAAARPLKGPLRRVVLDPGHGGRDPGARGKSGVEEKEICLDIALRLRRLIQERLPSVDVLLTRSDDRTVSLRERTEIANRSGADLFISIHTNASLDRRSRGSQVFFYDSRSSDRAAEDLARRENEDANYLEILMTDLAKSLVRDQSIRLAELLQDGLGRDVGVRQRGLSYAPFYVLARTQMPAVLVEVAFLSNPHEERLLGNSTFRQQVAEGILKGLVSYARESSAASLGSFKPRRGS